MTTSIEHTLDTSLSRDLFQQVQRLETLENDILATLSQKSEEEIIKIRTDARCLGIFSWKIECACDAALLNKANYEYRPTIGRPDTEGKGMTPALLKRMKALGCSHMTIRRNAKIFNEFGDHLNATVKTLPDKGYYLAALETDDPQATISLFIEKKIATPKFNVAEANRIVGAIKREREVAKENFTESNATDVRKELQTHILKTISQVETIKANCPDIQFGKRFYDSFIQELRDHLDLMFEEDASKALQRAWEDGFRKEDQMSAHTGLPRETVSQVMRMLKASGEFYIVEQRGETDAARGGHAKLWWKVGEPTGDGYNKSRL